MNALKMKVVSFDLLTSTIEVRFASDRAERPIDGYPSHVIQVIEQDGGADLDTVLKTIAASGWEVAAQQQAAEDQAKNNERMAAYAALVGQEFDYAEDALFAPQACVAAPNQPTTTGMMEL